MTDIFLSYAKEDIRIAQRLARALEDEGWSVWWDYHIPTGEAFYEVITKKIDGSRCVVVLWSKNSVDSKWVKAEANEGWTRGILIPAALVTNMEILPLPFKVVQTASLVGWKGEKFHPGYQSMVDRISALAGQPRLIRPRCEPKPQLEAQFQPQAGLQSQAHSQPRSSSAFPIPKWKIAVAGRWTIAVAAFLMVVSIGFLVIRSPPSPPLPNSGIGRQKIVIKDYGRHYQLYRGDVLLGMTPHEFEATIGEKVQLECLINNKHVQTLVFTVSNISNSNEWACIE